MKEKRLFSKFTSSYVVKAMLIIYVAIMVVLNVNVNTTQAATDKIMFNGVWYYFVDDELVSEYEYWQAKVQEYRYYDAGKLVTMSDGTVLWYGANKIYDTEEEAVRAYVTEKEVSGGYEMDDGSYVWFWKGQILDSKETYAKEVAKQYKECNMSGSKRMADGTIIYCYEGNVYYEEVDYYKARGYAYATSEAEGKKAIDAWFDKGNSAVEFNFVGKDMAALADYYEEKYKSLFVNGVSASYRNYILKNSYRWCRDSFGDLTIEAEMFTDNHGTEAQIKEARAAAKKIAEGLKGKTTYQQIKGAYEWLCNNVKYDHSLKNHSAYSALVTKNTVCEGYATAFQLIMEELGIECYVVANTSHAWNAVKLDGKLYWVDATWGDQVSYIEYKWFLCGTNARSNKTDLTISSKTYKNGSNSGNVGAGGNSTSGATQKATEKTTQKSTQATTQTTTEKLSEKNTENITETIITEQVTTNMETETTLETTTVAQLKSEEETTSIDIVTEEPSVEETTTHIISEEVHMASDNEQLINNKIWVTVLISAICATIGGAVLVMVCSKRM